MPACEDGEGGPSVHLAAPVGALGVVELEVLVEVGLHLVEGLVPGGAALHAEVLIEEGPVEALDEAVGLGPADLGGPVLDVLELEEELVGMPVGTPTELAAVVGEHGVDLDAVLVEEGQHPVVQDVDGRDGQLRGVEVPPGHAAEGVEDGLEVDLPDALEGADEEGVDGHEIAGEAGFDMAFPELGAVALQEPDLLLGEGELPLGGPSLRGGEAARAW
jgi:hypothetical protein